MAFGRKKRATSDASGNRSMRRPDYGYMGRQAARMPDDGYDYHTSSDYERGYDGYADDYDMPYERGSESRRHRYDDDRRRSETGGNGRDDIRKNPRSQLDWDDQYDNDEYNRGYDFRDEYGEHGESGYNSRDDLQDGDSYPYGRHSGHREDSGHNPQSRHNQEPADGDAEEGEESADDWASRWSSWTPEEAFEEGNDDNSDLVESEFGEEYVETQQRKNQNLPSVERTRTMAETFVDRFKNGGTVGRRTATKKIVSMTAVSEADIPTIKKRLNRSNIPYNILMVIFSLVVVGASVYLYDYFRSMSKNDIKMNAITAQYTKPIVQTPSDIDIARVQVNETDMPPIVDFAGLQNLNGDVSSWLRVPGTTIDYPVMTTTEEAKYLRLDIEGNYSAPGCLFTDWDNIVPLEDDYHIVIYGHHMPWPTMFHDMSRYIEEPGFVDEHRKMYYETPSKTYVLKVIGIHKAQPSESEARRTIFSDSAEFQSYMDDRLSLNSGTYDSGDYNRKNITKLFTFITCTDSGTARCIVNAIVTEEYDTKYVPLVRAKMQGLIKADGTIDPDKEAQQVAEQEAQQQAEQEAQQQEASQ